MEGVLHFVYIACSLSSVLWTVKGTYYVKPTGRYEITEIPLPSSVIEQINKNNFQAIPNPAHVTRTGVHIQTSVQIPMAPQPAPSQPCPPPSTCLCPCPPSSSSGNPLYLRPLPKTNNQTNAHCTSLCICLCISGSFPPGVSPPVPIQPPKSNATGPNPVVASPLLKRLASTLFSSASSASKSTPSISTTSSSMSQQSTVSCPGIAGCSSSKSPVNTSSETIQTGSSVTPGPTLIPPMLPVAQGPKQK